MKAFEEKKVRQIAALLALALDRAGSAEGDNAAEHAARLMKDHGLTRQDVAASQDPVGGRQVPCSSASWCRRLWAAAATLSGARSLFARGGGTTVYGLPADVEVAVYLFDLLQLQLRREIERLMRMSEARPTRKDLTAARQSFALGVSHKVADILRAEKSTAGGSSSALVRVRDEKTSLIDRHLETIGVQVKAEKFTVRFHREAYEAGERVSLRRGLGAPARRRRALV